MTKDIFLSGLMVAHNEEEVVEEALKSLHFCDEIIVVLDRCTDKTASIAKKYATQVIEGGKAEDFHIEGVRRNTGIEACKGHWVLELDADERISPELATEIQSTIQKLAKMVITFYLCITMWGTVMFNMAGLGLLGPTRWHVCLQKVLKHGAMVWCIPKWNFITALGV